MYSIKMNPTTMKSFQHTTGPWSPHSVQRFGQAKFHQRIHSNVKSDISSTSTWTEKYIGYSIRANTRGKINSVDLAFWATCSDVRTVWQQDIHSTPSPQRSTEAHRVYTYHLTYSLPCLSGHVSSIITWTAMEYSRGYPFFYSAEIQKINPEIELTK